MRCFPILPLLILALAASAPTRGAEPGAGPGPATPDLAPERLSRGDLRLEGDRLSLRLAAGTEVFAVRARRRHGNGDVSLSLARPGTSGTDAPGAGLVTLGSEGAFGRLPGAKGDRWLLTDRDGTRLVTLPERGIEVNRCGLHDHPARPMRTPRPSQPTSATGAVIDLLLIYNRAFADRYPGSLLQTRLNHLVHIANQTAANSGLDVGFRLVGAERFDYRNDNSNFDFRNDIAASLAGEFRPGLSGLAALRYRLGADLVIGLRPHDIETRGSCGIAFFPENNPNLGVNVVSDGASSWSFCLDDVLTHEIGHNLGATHQLGAGGGVVDPVGSAFVRPGRFGTVMGSFGTGRADRFRGLAMFSNPGRPCGNEPCGNDRDTNNVRVMRGLLSAVAGYRAAPPGLPLPQALSRAPDDQDGDGVEDWFDALPFDATETLDSDGDGRGDGADAFPLDAREVDDTDGDGTGDRADTDDDNDGVNDIDDAFPRDAAEQADTDRDGVGDRADAFPGNAAEFRDTDGDGVGDNADPDDDADGVPELSATDQDLLVVSVGNRQLLRFDAATGAPRGVEVPPWDSRLTFQTRIAWRPSDQTLVYTGDSGLRRLDLLDRRLLGEWVPAYDDANPALQLGTGFPVGLAAVDGGRRVVAARQRDPQLATFRGQEAARGEPLVDWRLDEDEAPGDIVSNGETAWALGAGTRSIYRIDGAGPRRIAGPGLPWLQDPDHLAVTIDGRLLVSDRGRDAVLAVDADSGALLGTLADLHAAGYGGAGGIGVSAVGELLVAAARQDAVLAFDAATGVFLGERVRGDGLEAPGDLVLVPALRDRFPRDPARVLRPNAGLWWDPASDGRGFDLQVFGERLSVFWYTYEADGRPVWYLAAGALDGTRFNAPLNRFRRAGDGSVSARAVGTISLDFASEREAAVRWSVDGETGEESLSWIVLTPRLARPDPTGIWGRADAPGWGLSLASQGGVTVTVAYVYDAEGEPRWAISAPTEGSPPYRFDLFASFAPGLCPGCDGPAGSRLVPAGEMQLDLGEAAAWDSDLTWPETIPGEWRLTATPVVRFSDPAVRPR